MCSPNKNLLFLSLISLLGVTGCNDNKTIVQDREEGDACDREHQCVAPFVCRNDRCQRLCSNDDDCDILSQHCEDSVCKSGSAIVCGNGRIEPGEACDDNNKVNGDGCSSTCVVENNYSCNGEPSVCQKLCGNGVKDPGEACDDGNVQGGDGCSPTCTVEDNYRCNGEPSVCQQLCGNGEEDTGETCDDGNGLSGDGCSSKCNIEEHYTCQGWPSTCHCSSGYQDSNSDGICQPDCAANCTGRCYYAPNGTASCGCPSGQQDSNSDGTCQPDCDDSCTGRCYYAADGTATCGCPSGFQDNDGDGICNPTCESELNSGKLACKDFEICSTASGVAECICAVYVTADGKGRGSSWADANGDLAAAMDKAVSAMGILDSDTCSVLIAAGDYKFINAVTLKNMVSIFGGLSAGAVDFAERDVVNKRPKIDLTEAYLAGVKHFFTDLPCNKTDSACNVTDDDGVTATISGLEISGTYKIGERDYEAGGTVLYSELKSKLYLSDMLFRENVLVMEESEFGHGMGMMMEGGGALQIKGANADVTIDHCTFIGNGQFSEDSRLNGGAINQGAGVVRVLNSRFEGNAASSGGAIYKSYSSGAMYMDNNTFVGNHGSEGGALNGLFDQITNCRFYNNSASLGGAIRGAFKELSNSVFAANHARSWGGVISKIGGEGFMSNCLVVGNYITDSTWAGIIYQEGKILIVSNTLVAGNYSHSTYWNGELQLTKGTIFLGVNNTTLNHCTVADNTFRNTASQLFESHSGSTEQKGALMVNNSIFTNNIHKLMTESISPRITFNTSIDDMGDLPFATVGNNQGQWTAFEYDAQKDRTVFHVAGPVWQVGALRGSLVWPDTASQTNLAFPVADNGADYLEVEGDIASYGCYKISTGTNQYEPVQITAEEAAAYYDFTGKNFIIRNYDLTASSTAAIDAGTTETDIDRDILGRPRDAQPDIGAYEFQK